MRRWGTTDSRSRSTYRYLANSNSPQPSADTVESQYNDVTTVIPLTIAIKPEVKIEVLDVIPGNLVVGTEGYLNLTIKNIGPEDGKKASVILLRNGNSGVIPSDSSVYIGDFLKNQTVSCMYKVLSLRRFAATVLLNRCDGHLYQHRR